MENTNCFECGGKAEVYHHVIPKSLGGTKTIPLCKICHGLVHHPKLVSISMLTKKGIKRKREKRASN